MTTSTDQIKFLSDYRPALDDGDYTITVTQNLSDTNKKISQSALTTTRDFSVLGPRFSLDPQEVRAVFPPDGSLGEHSNVLPHIIFNRATLPWERSANPKANGNDETQDPPWLMLLVFDEDKAPVPQTVTLSDLGFPKMDAQGKLPKWGTPDSSKIKGKFYTGLTPEYGQHPDDPVQLITIHAALLNAILPTNTELQWLAHARQATQTDKATEADEPFAVIFANRLPTPKGQTTVHLVSLEGLYTGGTFLYANEAQDISLITLKSWRFTCISPEHDFKNLLLHLDAQSFHIPADEKPLITQSYLEQGLAPFTHLMRQGNRSVSWYRGPLLPGKSTNPEITFPAPNADALVGYYPNLGMFDITYAAAWELGRLLTLQNKRVSVDLFNWKHAHIQQQKDQKNASKHLPMTENLTVSEDIPPAVSTWFEQLCLLKGIPFNYLVPDENLLPAESIRFFQVDSLWIQSLIDGALAVGHIPISKTYQPESKYKNLSGVLLRSAVVAGYPDLLVTGYDATQVGVQHPIPLHSFPMQRLSNNVLLCLFEGEIAQVDIHQKPESLHFGFDVDKKDSENLIYSKTLRNQDGSDAGPSFSPITAHWRTQKNQQVIAQLLKDYQLNTLDELEKKLRVVDIDLLQGNIKNELVKDGPQIDWSVAQFAMQMIEGVEQVQFSIISPKLNA